MENSDPFKFVLTWVSLCNWDPSNSSSNGSQHSPKYVITWPANQYLETDREVGERLISYKKIYGQDQ